MLGRIGELKTFSSFNYIPLTIFTCNEKLNSQTEKAEYKFDHQIIIQKRVLTNINKHQKSIFLNNEVCIILGYLIYKIF